MRRILYLTGLVLVFQLPVDAQDIYDKLSRVICKCYEKEKVTDFANDNSCMEKYLLANLSEVMKYHKLQSITELDSDEVSYILMGKLAKKCDYWNRIANDSITMYNPKFIPDVNPECSNFHEGDYFYIQLNTETDLYDTTYVTFTKDEYLERMYNGKTYSRLSLKWPSDCAFRLVFIESNDPFKKSYSKKGDVYEYQILKVEPGSMMVQYMWDGPDFFLEFFRVN